MQAAADDRRNLVVVKTLTYLMFAMFAMTTDSVGIIIPEVIRTFQLSLTAAGTFQYATMAGIAFAGLLLGQLADRFGRRRTIVVGLTLFATACFLFAVGEAFLFFTVLMGLSGVAIGVFKTGALALIGDISTSTAQHTSIMNTAEGFFGIGAIFGPGDPGPAARCRTVVEVALRHRRRDVRVAHRAGADRPVSRDTEAVGTDRRSGHQ